MSLTTQIFVEAVKAHQLWLNNKPGGKRANLSYETVSGLKLAGLNFSRAKMSGMDFSKCNLVGANFTEADLFGADFSYADLTKANFTEADLRGAQFFNANLTEANLHKVDLRHGEVLAVTSDDHQAHDKRKEKTRERQVRMVASNLSEAAMVNAAVSQADLTGAKIGRTHL